MLLLFIILIILVLVMFLIFPEKPAENKSAPFDGRFIAHRGLHQKDKSIAENSCSAFRSAVEHGYGIEFDLQLSSDGIVMVFHDDSLMRVCGVDGLIEQTSKQDLQQLRLCGTEDTIPTFNELLEIVNGKVPLIVELKKSTRREELCRKVYERLKDYDGEYCIESFDPLIVAWFKKNAPLIYRGQLITNQKDYGKMNWLLTFMLSHGLFNFLARPNFIAHNLCTKTITVRFAEILGAKRISWVARSQNESGGNDTVIFEFFEPDIRF